MPEVSSRAALAGDLPHISLTLRKPEPLGGIKHLRHSATNMLAICKRSAQFDCLKNTGKDVHAHGVILWLESNPNTVNFACGF